ncbi:hypothetical protein J1614_011570 [Plenodomus biglobosus]|nr:hypothetical protein J1614_011570 [Plenodomus biglobosus]
MRHASSSSAKRGAVAAKRQETATPTDDGSQPNNKKSQQAIAVAFVTWPPPRLSLPLIFTSTMADRFPSLDEIDAGHTEARGDTTSFDLVGDSNDADDFLSRERALLGDDADQFASENDRVATVEDGDDDLLGGDYTDANAGSQEMSGFESSFPAIDTTNDVSTAPPS